MSPPPSSVPPPLRPPPPPPPPPPLTIPKIQYTVRSPWEWVMDRIAIKSEVAEKLVQLGSPLHMESSELLLNYAQAKSTPSNARSRNRARSGSHGGGHHNSAAATLRLELLDDEDRLMEPCYYGTSSAMDGLEDKDELARTLQRCRCDHLGLTPPSVLIKWDVTREELKNMIKELPILDDASPSKKRNGISSTAPHSIAVLKEPMGSRGEGIYFIKTLDEMYEIVELHRKRALNEGSNFLDSVMARKGRIPSWVLQAEVHPSRLIRQRKFHIRCYVVLLEKLHVGQLLDVLLFRRHEVRIAAVPIDDGDDPNKRNRDAHITNGAHKDTTERVLMDTVPEIADLQHDLEVFCAKFMQSVWPDLTRRINYTAEDMPFPAIRKFALAGLDIMMTADNRFYLLEVNVNPSAPPPHTISKEFKEHLESFFSEFINLVLHPPERREEMAPNFKHVLDILDQPASP